MGLRGALSLRDGDRRAVPGCERVCVGLVQHLHVEGKALSVIMNAEVGSGLQAWKPVEQGARAERPGTRGALGGAHQTLSGPVQGGAPSGIRMALRTDEQLDCF